MRSLVDTGGLFERDWANATLAAAAYATTLASSSARHIREVALQAGLRVWAEIDLDALAANVGALGRLAGSARLLAVVKGNAYGHGAVGVAREALAAGAWGLGVIDVSEGEALRLAGIQAPILVLGSSPAALAGRIIANDLRVTIASLDVAAALSAAAQESGKVALVHLKVETGLNRFGLRPPEAIMLAQQLRGLPGLELEGVSTHLASADEEDEAFTMRQYAAFRACADELHWVELRHVASTGALLKFPALGLDLVRCGIGIYGYYPAETMKHPLQLAPVLSLRTRVGRVLDIDAGESVGYARAWTAARRSRIALAMAGYADGIPRSLSGKGDVLLAGQRAPRVGRVAMDMHMLDITNITNEVVTGDEVTLIGRQQGSLVDAHEIAAAAGTISYEILAGIAARVPRLFHRGGQLCAVEDSSGYRETSAL